MTTAQPIPREHASTDQRHDGRPWAWLAAAALAAALVFGLLARGEDESRADARLVELLDRLVTVLERESLERDVETTTTTWPAGEQTLAVHTSRAPLESLREWLTEHRRTALLRRDVERDLGGGMPESGR
jgi:hypothetical protein